MNYAAHELLEMSEALNSKKAEIEQHGLFISQAKDQQLKNILSKHQQQMITGYQQGINLLQGKGGQVPGQAPHFQTHDLSVGMSSQASPSSAPQPNTVMLSDQTISALALSAHKSGAISGMQFANETVDPQLRSYHVNGAVQCQEMGYEIWTWMNQHGHYQPATFSTAQTNQMTHMFQPMNQQMNHSMQQMHYSNPNQMQQ
ncbi:spore coat protein [Radiobacillus kanasensis]|uniref:spore coat protein n=1 Tax=Radiobacillus kanasensis TaxID=2844358 RepID=UPI001E5C6369|nr:spore coat protein [Radiobacillus kanasensis]UFU00030.1 spore coat protein [Radiobacillus kanasensis]